MIVDVEVLVVDPHRSCLVVGNLHHPLTQPRHPMHAPSDVGLEFIEAQPPVVAAQRCAFEHRQRSDVLRLVRRLDAQEHCVCCGQSFVLHRGPVVSFLFASVTIGRLSDRDQRQ